MLRLHIAGRGEPGHRVADAEPAARRAPAGAADGGVRGDRRWPQDARASIRSRARATTTRWPAIWRKLGWTQADMQLFSDERALSRAPPEKVCQLVHDWFAAQLDIKDQDMQLQIAGGFPEAGGCRLSTARPDRSASTPSVNASHGAHPRPKCLARALRSPESRRLGALSRRRAWSTAGEQRAPAPIVRTIGSAKASPEWARSRIHMPCGSPCFLSPLSAPCARGIAESKSLRGLAHDFPRLPDSDGEHARARRG